MKKFSLPASPFIISAFILLLNGKIQGQTIGTSPSSYNEVVPGLTFLKSGFPFVKQDKQSTYEVFIDTPGIRRFTGHLLNTGNLKKELGVIMAEQGQFKDDFKTLVASIEIYCDSFVLNEKLWLPECNLTIHSRIINMQNNDIDVSPLPWRYANANDRSGETNIRNGANGRDGGNIKIVCDEIINRGKLLANGTNGEWIVLPKAKIEYPKTLTGHYEVHHNNGCDNRSDRSIGLDFKADNYCIGLVFNNIEGCTKSETFDKPGGVVFKKNDDVDAGLEDKKEKDRVTFFDGTNWGKKILKPGGPGNAGHINVVHNRDMSLPVTSARPGNSGKYLPRTDDIENSLYKNGRFSIAADKSCTGVSFNNEFYSSYVYEVSKNKILGITHSIDCKIIKDKEKQIRVPSFAVEKELDDELNLFRGWTTNGKWGGYNEVQKKYIPDPDYLKYRFKELEVQFSIYYQKTAEEQLALNKKLESLIQELSGIIEINDMTPADKSSYLSVLNQAARYVTASVKNLDEYKNAPGYRPALSMTSTMNYLNKNLESDIRQFVLADIMTSSEKNMGDYLNKIPELITNLEKENNDLAGETETLAKEETGLQTKARELVSQTKAIEEDLKTLEGKVRGEMEKDAERKKYWSWGLKGAALIASLVPYGQPVLGQVVGNSLTAIADNINEDPKKIAASVISKIDLSAVASSIAGLKMRIMGPEKPGESLDEIEIRPRSNVKDLTAFAKTYKKEDYVNKKNEYDKKLAETESKFAKYAVMGRDKLADYIGKSASAAEMDQKLAALANSDPRFKSITQKIALQNQLKQDVFEKLNKIVQQNISLRSKMIENTEEIYQLRLFHLDSKKNYNKDLKEAIENIREHALDRLKWIEYQMVKVYEYTTLKTYHSPMPSNEIFNVLYGRKRKSILDKTLEINNIVEELKIGYEGQRRKMEQTMLTDITVGHKQDDNQSGRKIILQMDKTNPENLLNKLNDNPNEGIVLDLQRDFVEEIIKPNESETRILNISLDAIKFDKEFPKGSNVEVSVELTGDGILRKENEFYLFAKDADPNAVTRWKWTIRGKNEVSNKSVPSEQYEDLIQFVTGSKSSGKNLFTLPPAWTKLRIKLNYAGNTDAKLEELQLNMRCDYVDINDESTKTIDIKIDDAPYGTLIEKTIDTRNADTLFTNQYTLVQKGARLKLKLIESAKEPGDESALQFERWDISGLSEKEKAKLDLTGTILEMPINNHTRIRAVFKNPGIAPPRQANSIVLYELPDISSKQLAIVTNESDYQVIDATPANGFIMVLFKGKQEAYLKKE